MKETDLASANVLNSLRAVGLDNYSNTSAPQVAAPQILDSNVYIYNATPLGPVIPSTVQAVEFRTQANGVQSDGSHYTGVYQLGYQILNAATGEVATDKSGNALDFFNPPPTGKGPMQTYLTIPASLLTLPGDAFDTTTSHGGAPGESPQYFYNFFANNRINSLVPFDVTSLNSGNYQVCVIASDIANPTGLRGQGCTHFPTGPWPFLDGESVGGVFGEARVCGLKLGSERLHGIQARAIPRRREPLHGIKGLGQEFGADRADDGTRFFRPERRFYRLAAIAGFCPALLRFAVNPANSLGRRFAKPSVRAEAAERPSNRFVNACSLARLAGYEPSSLSPAVRRRAPHAHACDSSVSRREHSTRRPSGGRESGGFGSPARACARGDLLQDRGFYNG